MQISSLNVATPPTRTQTSGQAGAPLGDRFDFKQDCLDQAGWLAQECRSRFNCTPNELMKGPGGFERFSQLAAEWRDAHPRS